MPMMKMNELWEELEAEIQSQPSNKARAGILTRLATPDPLQRLSVGIEMPAKARVLLFTAHTEVLPQRATWPECRGLELSLDEERSGSATLIVRLRDALSQDVFSVLAYDLAHRAIGGSEQDAARRVLAALGRWQRFMAAAARSLSDDARRGLWGELWALEHLIIPAVGVEAAVAAWHGPEGAPQDFQHNGAAIEVKTRAARSPAVVRISGEQQLHDAPWRHLLLVHIGVDEQDGAGETLPERIAKLRALASNTTAEEMLEDALADAHWFDTETEKHQIRGFVRRELDVFRVTDAFPRLSPPGLPAGIGGVTYDLSLDAARPFACSLEDLRDGIKQKT
jgi:hypothetical protein